MSSPKRNDVEVALSTPSKTGNSTETLDATKSKRNLKKIVAGVVIGAAVITAIAVPLALRNNSGKQGVRLSTGSTTTTTGGSSQVNGPTGDYNGTAYGSLCTYSSSDSLFGVQVGGLEDTEYQSGKVSTLGGAQIGPCIESVKAGDKFAFSLTTVESVNVEFWTVANGCTSGLAPDLVIPCVAPEDPELEYGVY